MRNTLAGLMAVATVTAAGATSRAQVAPEAEAPALPAARLWVGPMPFAGPRTLRDDFFPILSDPGKWLTVLANTDVFKSHLMILPNAPVPGKPTPELSEAQLRQLATLFRERGIKVAFEVGGLRMGNDKPQKGEWGKQVAANEFTPLKRWLDAGGTIDYLTTDHAVMMNLGHRCYEGTDCGLTLDETLDELAVYFEEMARRIPGVRFGCIESLGFFHVKAPDGTEYPRTVPKLPIWHFEDYFDALLAALARHHLALDHFHIDFGFEGVDYDGRRLKKGGPDFGHILGVKSYVQSKGVHVGPIVNAFHDRSVENPDPAVASRQAYDRTLQFFNAYVAAGGTADQLVVQTWQPFPDRTGPDDRAYTTLNLAREVMTSEAFRRALSAR